MKKLLLLFCLVTGLVSAGAQVQRYVLLEHFTNSKCGICAGKNPAFYDLIDNYPNAIHHVAVHPSFPYVACVFHQANTVENTAWVSQYSISSTPRVAVNGTLVPLGGLLLPQATLEAALNQTSNLYLQVAESGTGASRSVVVKARSEGQIPGSNLHLFVAVLEKTINLTTSNGETVHHDVFRDMLTDVAGAPFTPAAPGQEVQFNYNYTVNAAWNANEVYVLAFVKNMDTGEVINSGTRFDSIVSGTTEPLTAGIRILPNPATEQAQVLLPAGVELQSLRLFDLSGREQRLDYDSQPGKAVLRLAALKSGIYLLRIVTDRGLVTRKLIKSDTAGR